MNNRNNSSHRDDIDSGALLLRYIIGFSWIVLVLFTVGSWYIVDLTFAQSVFVGGVLINGSFLLLKRDLEQLFLKVGNGGTQAGGVPRIERTRFLLKYFARLVVLALMIFVATTKMSINMIGLTVGLTTVMFSVVMVVLSKGKMLYGVQSLRRA